MLYTRKGDDGTSGLFGTKERFPKDSAIYEALGTLDELNSLLGFCRALSVLDGKTKISEEILNAQECLFIIQAEAAGSNISLTNEHVNSLEDSIDFLERSIVAPEGFVIPGATKLGAILDFARSLSRRTERRIISVSKSQLISKESLAYLNRLSSLLYVLARYAVKLENKKEISPTY